MPRFTLNRFRKNEIISRDRNGISLSDFFLYVGNRLTDPKTISIWPHGKHVRVKQRIGAQSFNLIVKLVFLAKKRGVMEGNGGEGAAAEGPRRSPRGGGAIVSYLTPKYSPGDAALKAAHEYLEGRFESPVLAAQHWLVERQHVNYYVRKLAAQGLVSSKMSTSRASIEPMMPISLDKPDGSVAEEVSAHETWCAAWRFAAELVHVLGM